MPSAADWSAEQGRTEATGTNSSVTYDGAEPESALYITKQKINVIYN